MIIKIYNNYSIDECGNIYNGDKKIKPYISRGYYQIMIGRKCTSYGKLIATYLIFNPYNYNRITYIDGNPLNCNKENIKWVSEKEYQKKQSITKIKKNTNINFKPDLKYFNSIFIDTYNDMIGYKKNIYGGEIYIQIYEKYIRGATVNLRAEILTMYKYIELLEIRKTNKQ